MFIHTETLAYPLSAQEIIAAHRNVSFPVPFEPLPIYALVHESPRPKHDPAVHIVVERPPARNAEGWHQSWVVRDMTAAEVAAYLQSIKPPVPTEVPRWAGRLALKRHVLQGGALMLLGPAETRADNLLARTLAWRATLAPGELADRVDAALDDAKDWVLASETVSTIAGILGLSAAQVRQLFMWAGEQRV